MSDESIIGFGARCSVNDGDGDEHEDFKNVLSFNFPDEEVGEYETTKLNNLNDDGEPSKARTFKATLEDNGSVSVEGFFTKDEYVRLRALKGKSKEFKLFSPDPDGTDEETGAIATFDGFLKKLSGPKFEKDKEVMVSFEIRVSGEVTIDDAENTEP